MEIGFNSLGIDYTSPVFLWSLGLIIGIPFLVLGLSELMERLRKSGSAYESSVRALRSFFLPAFTFALITVFILTLTQDNLTRRIVMTLFYFALAFTVLAFVGSIKVNEKDKDRWESRLPGITKTIARVLAVLLPFALVVSTVWDLNLTKFMTAIGVGSIAIAFALQNTLSSVISGFLLALDKPFREGDWIEINGHTGKVIDLNWRTTKLEVDGRDIVVIPNTTLLDSSLKNYTVIDIGYRDKISFGFAYKDLPNKVKDVALQVARECPYVADHPLPEVHTLSYDDSSVGYEMYFHMDKFESAFQARRIREDLMTRLFYAAARHDLEIPFPIRTLRETHTGDMSDAERAALALSALKDNMYTKDGGDEVLEELAQSAIVESFGRGTPITFPGVHDPGIRIVMFGRVELKNDAGLVLSQTQAGDVFGIRHLVGRRPNQYTTIAATDVETLLFPSDSLDDAMGRAPQLAGALHGLADRRLEAMSRWSDPDKEKSANKAK